MGHCYNTIALDVPIEQVWAKIKDFHDLSWGEPVITRVDVLGEVSGDQVGARRLLNEVFYETLLSIEPEHFTFSYRIDDGPGPVAKDAINNYIGKVSLRPITDTGGTFVEWVSTYETDDEAAVAEFCNPIYAAVLAELKNRFS